jgi:predicted hydrocarbon binding protein
MFEYVKKLLFSRQLKLEKGAIELLGNPAVMFPASIFSFLLFQSKDKSKIGREIYYSSKESSKKTLTNYIESKYNLKSRELINVMMDIAMLGGWGEWKLILLKDSEKHSIIQIVNSPLVRVIKRNTNFPVDHVMRGLHAGAAEIIFKTEVDAVETKCQAMGDPYCELVLKPTEEWKKEKNKKYTSQLFPKVMK